MRGKFLLQMMLALFLIPSVTATASKTDPYRDAILSKNFTLKYTVEIPPTFKTSNDANFGSKGMTIKDSMNFSDFPHGGIVVVDGDDSYTEVFTGGYISSFKTKMAGEIDNHYIIAKAGGNCTLIKDNEVFTFFWDLKNDQRRYYGAQGFFGKSKSVKANDAKYDVTPYQKFMRDYSLGSSEITNALLPILPPDKILDLPGIPHYEFFDSGSLDNGLTYEDFVSDDPNLFSAVRYYFDGDNMTKIAFASYVKNGSKIEGYTRSVIKILGFANTAEEKYLSLPAELKDKTKREDKK